jgi:hypothetical protein
MAFAYVFVEHEGLDEDFALGRFGLAVRPPRRGHGLGLGHGQKLARLGAAVDRKPVNHRLVLLCDTPKNINNRKEGGTAHRAVAAFKSKWLWGWKMEEKDVAHLLIRSGADVGRALKLLLGYRAAHGKGD